jgi:hypothetical protein
VHSPASILATRKFVCKAHQATAYITRAPETESSATIWESFRRRQQPRPSIEINGIQPWMSPTDPRRSHFTFINSSAAWFVAQRQKRTTKKKPWSELIEFAFIEIQAQDFYRLQRGAPGFSLLAWAVQIRPLSPQPPAHHRRDPDHSGGGCSAWTARLLVCQHY